MGFYTGLFIGAKITELLALVAVVMAVPYAVPVLVGAIVVATYSLFKLAFGTYVVTPKGMSYLGDCNDGHDWFTDEQNKLRCRACGKRPGGYDDNART